MQVISQRTGDKLVAKVSGHLNASTAPEFDTSLDLQGVRELILDLLDCDFISSAGIRSIMKANQQMKKCDGTICLKNVAPLVFGVFELTGLSAILPIQKKMREISLDNLEMFSSGVCGECYRIDSETVVKLYRDGVAPHIAEQEKQFAKAAFVMGIPTALSYDVVSCGTRSGVVFEFLDATLFSDVIRNDLASMDRYAKMLSDTSMTLHTAKGDNKILPNMKERMRGYIRDISYLLTAEQSELFLAKLESIPDDDHCVHFDLHSSNIMMQNQELIIIDMGDLSIGSYLFDVGLIYLIYGIPELGISQMATKIPVDQGVEFWNCFKDHYFAERSEEERKYFDDNKYFLASLRIIHVITFLTHVREEFENRLTKFLLPRILEENA